ncbi:hypothetical protein H8A97_08425 [Bradyrhizobium sp. Arg62]|uniref:hypothetical protein n=1 Tax=Bradyrhizobium TaxID=374 RepID=UPI001E4313B0|nr:MULTISPECIES: hypothetical protein [Bradyrhizobium]MCC8936977.1 hypothetical protein [Bradyrhizobium ivorense]MCC8945134.1 hypothetical protein [Bradyrhizobium brasilense]
MATGVMGLEDFMQHRGVQFSIQEALPGQWRYSFKIDGKTISGKTQTRLQLLAVRRVKDRINRELNRSAESES